MAYNQQSLTQYGHTVLFPKSDPNIGCLAAFRNPPSETDYANKNVYPTLGGYGPPILAHIKRTNVGQQPQTKLQSQLKFDFHHDVPDSEIVEQATNDVYNHGRKVSLNHLGSLGTPLASDKCFNSSTASRK